MKKCKFTHLLTLSLLLCALFCAAPPASAVSTAEMQQMLKELPLTSHQYTYTGGTARTYYSHALLFRDSRTDTPYPDLTKASMALSATAYDAKNINTLLSSMGFTAVESNEASYNKVDNEMTITDCDHVGYTIAKAADVINPISKQPYVIYCIPIQGTKAALEWASDFNLGNGKEHEGFSNAAQEIFYDLIPYLDSDGYDKYHTILWFTGHSRGAACANLLAGWFSSGNNSYVSQDNVFGYTFACPAVSQNADTTMTNIYNFNNPGDLIPMLPLPEWGYYCYGQTLELDTSTMGFGNFTLRFSGIKGVKYEGSISGDDHRAILSSLGKNEDLDLILDLLGWTMGGCQLNDLKEILKDHTDPAAMAIKYIIAATPPGQVVLKAVDLLDRLIGQDKQNAELMEWAMAAYNATKHMDPEAETFSEEFGAYLKSKENSDKVQLLQKISGVTIKTPNSFREAWSRLNNDSSNFIRGINSMKAVQDLILDDVGNVGNRILQPHDRVAYHTWINSMFYGYGGWKGNTLIESVPRGTDIQVDFPLDDSFYSIGEGCFQNCSAVTEADLPDSITQVGDYAFYNCDKLAEIWIPDNVVYIGTNSFYDCDGLTSIRIPDATTQMGGSAFYSCSNVTSLTLPADLSYGSAFNGVSKLKTIHYTPGATGVMPDRKNDLSTSTNFAPEFLSSNVLQEVIFDDGITHIASYLMQFNSNNQSRSSLTSVVLPDTLESIGEEAFRNCYFTVFKTNSGLQWPKGLTTIGKWTFSNCDTLPDYPMTLTAFPVGCFAHCDGLTEITIADHFTEIGNNAFYNCKNVTSLTVPVDLNYNNAFESINGIQTIHYTPGATGVMPDRKNDLSTSTNFTPEFESCNALKEVIFDDGITHIASYLMQFNSNSQSRSSLTSVILPDTLESIGEQAFYNCYYTVFKTNSGLQWPKGLTTIGKWTFSNCDTLPNYPMTLTAFPVACFANCDGLTEITIADHFTEIGNLAFYNCKNVTSLTVPVDLNYNNAFESITGIQTIHYTPGATGVMPDRKNDISTSTNFTPEFESCSTLKEVIFDDGITHIASYLMQFNSNNQSRSSLTSVIFPSTLESIGERAFYNCPNTVFRTNAGLQWPEGLTTIGSYTFYNCDTLTNYPMTLTAFPVACFANCDGLTEITIADHFTEIGNLAFYNCKNVTSLTVPVDLNYNNAFESITGIQTIHYTPGATGVMPDRKNDISTSTNFTPEFLSSNVLQEVIFDDGITHIASYLMQFNSNSQSRKTLTSVVLPDTLESIGRSAFLDCPKTVFKTNSGLQWPEGLTTIGIDTFSNCDTLPDYPMTLTAFPVGCFAHCDGLTEITIKDHFTEIGNFAFYNCKNVTSLTIPVDLNYHNAFESINGIQTIHYTPGASGVMPDRKYDLSTSTNYTPEFESCSTLKEVIFDDGITHIASYLMQFNSNNQSRSSLTSVTFPATLESIGERAFYDCYNTTFSDWPIGVTSIGANAFSYCSKLGDLTFTGDAPTIGSYAFSSVTTTAYYPQYNETWTADTLQNYGGNLTWIPLSCDGTHTEVPFKGTAPTCSQPGLTDGTRCAGCGEILTPQEEIPATGKHTSDTAPAFTWDEAFDCTAAFTCRECAEQITVPCAVSSQTIPADGDKPAQILYTATVILGETTYTDTKTVDAPETEHTHTPEEAWQNDLTSHWKQCTGCEEKLELDTHTPNSEKICSVCGIQVTVSSDLFWLLDRAKDPNSYLWASGHYVTIMEQYD